MKREGNTAGKMVLAVLAGIAAYKLLDNPTWFTTGARREPVLVILSGLALGFWFLLSE